MMMMSNCPDARASPESVTCPPLVVVWRGDQHHYCLRIQSYQLVLGRRQAARATGGEEEDVGISSRQQVNGVAEWKFLLIKLGTYIFVALCLVGRARCVCWEEEVRQRGRGEEEEEEREGRRRSIFVVVHLFVYIYIYIYIAG